MRATAQWGIRAHGDNMEITNAVWHNEDWKEWVLRSRMVDDESDPYSEIQCRIMVDDMKGFIALWGALSKTDARLTLTLAFEHDHAKGWATLDTDSHADIILDSEARSSDIEKAAVEAVKALNGAMHKHEGI